jgi:hypothetical protein
MEDDILEALMRDEIRGEEERIQAEEEFPHKKVFSNYLWLSNHEDEKLRGE